MTQEPKFKPLKLPHRIKDLALVLLFSELVWLGEVKPTKENEYNIAISHEGDNRPLVTQLEEYRKCDRRGEAKDRISDFDTLKGKFEKLDKMFGKPRIVVARAPSAELGNLSKDDPRNKLFDRFFEGMKTLIFDTRHGKDAVQFAINVPLSLSSPFSKDKDGTDICSANLITTMLEVVEEAMGGKKATNMKHPDNADFKIDHAGGGYYVNNVPSVAQLMETYMTVQRFDIEHGRYQQIQIFMHVDDFIHLMEHVQQQLAERKLTPAGVQRDFIEVDVNEARYSHVKGQGGQQRTSALQEIVRNEKRGKPEKKNIPLTKAILSGEATQNPGGYYKA